MAIAHDKRRGTWLVRFRWPCGRQGTERTYKCKNEREAKSKDVSIKEMITRLTDNTFPMAIPPEVEDQALWIFSGGSAGFREIQPEGKPITIRELIDQFLEHRKGQIGNGPDGITVATYADDKYQLEAFAGYCAKMKKSGLDEIVRPDFLDKHKASAKAASSVVTLWHSVKAVKRLLVWGWKHDRLESLPPQPSTIMRKWSGPSQHLNSSRWMRLKASTPRHRRGQSCTSSWR